MKIKDYKCKCGHDDFFFVDKGNQKGIYCSYCNSVMGVREILEIIDKYKSENEE